MRRLIPLFQDGLRARRWLLVLAAMCHGLAAMNASAPPARSDPFMPSVQEQIKAGDQAARGVEKKYKAVHDGRAGHLQVVGNRLLKALGKDAGPWHWKFHLIESKDVNAFALPGGNIFFFTGLYDLLKNDDELAAVLGHEMTHVRKQHWAHQYADQKKRELGIGVLLGILHMGKKVDALANIGDSLLNLQYSRGDEEQADLGGLDNMVKAGYNPNGMLQMFDVLKKASGSTSGLPEFLSDHPLTSHRIQLVRNTIRKKYPQFATELQRPASAG